MAKIQKWFNKILGREEEKMLPEPEEKQELGKSEKIKAASELDKAEKPKEQDKGQDEKDESFKEYIRAVARNGVKGANAEDKLPGERKMDIEMEMKDRKDYQTVLEVP